MSTVPAAGGAPAAGVPPLLRRFVDDAALVAGGPRRAMDEVVDAHLDAHAAHGDVIGSLVVPVSRLSELVADLVRRRPAAPVAVSLSVDTGLGGVPKAFSLTSSRPALLAPVTVEMPAPHDVDGTWLERVTEFVPDDVVAVVEPRRPDTPADGATGGTGREVSDWLDGVRRVVAHGCRPKLRCGGGRAGAFPRDDDVAGFLAVVLGAGRPFTASIGLQGAVRHVDDSTGVTHHGWLNILVATARLVTAGRERGPTDPGTDTEGAVIGTLTDALAGTDTAALSGELDALDPETAARTRELFPSFGSTDPREAGTEMTRLGLVRSA